MTRTLVPFVALLAALTWSPQVEAKVACFSIDESFTLTPSGGVTLNGLILQRSATTGRYTDDAGLDFDVNRSTVAVVPIQSVCNTTATTLTLVTSDPFAPFAGVDAGTITIQVHAP